MGGGKETGGDAVEAPKSYNTITSVGSALDPESKGFGGTLASEDESDTDKVSRKKMGTRGLRIPTKKGG